MVTLWSTVSIRDGPAGLLAWAFRIPLCFLTGAQRPRAQKCSKTGKSVLLASQAQLHPGSSVSSRDWPLLQSLSPGSRLGQDEDEDDEDDDGT